MEHTTIKGLAHLLMGLRGGYLTSWIQPISSIHFLPELKETLNHLRFWASHLMRDKNMPVGRNKLVRATARTGVSGISQVAIPAYACLSRLKWVARFCKANNLLFVIHNFADIASIA